MKDLAVSMDFDLSKYQLNDMNKAEDGESSNEESFETVLNKVNNILGEKK